MKPEICLELMKNKYGNFVLNKCLKQCNKQEYKKFLEVIE